MLFFLWACLVWGKRKENSVRAKQSWRGRVKTNKSSSCLWYRLPSSRLYHYFATAVPGPPYSSDTPSESSCYSSELSMTSIFTESWHLEHAGLTVVVEIAGVLHFIRWSFSHWLKLWAIIFENHPKPVGVQLNLKWGFCILVFQDISVHHSGWYKGTIESEWMNLIPGWLCSLPFHWICISG